MGWHTIDAVGESMRPSNESHALLEVDSRRAGQTVVGWKKSAIGYVRVLAPRFTIRYTGSADASEPERLPQDLHAANEYATNAMPFIRLGFTIQAHSDADWNSCYKPNMALLPGCRTMTPIVANVT